MFRTSDRQLRLERTDVLSDWHQKLLTAAPPSLPFAPSNLILTVIIQVSSLSSSNHLHFFFYAFFALAAVQVPLCGGQIRNTPSALSHGSGGRAAIDFPEDAFIIILGEEHSDGGRNGGELF